MSSLPFCLFSPFQSLTVVTAAGRLGPKAKAVADDAPMIRAAKRPAACILAGGWGLVGGEVKVARVDRRELSGGGGEGRMDGGLLYISF